jgi:hypothetical protein
MSSTARPTGGASEHQQILPDTQQLQHLVQAVLDGPGVNFRAIHEVVSRIMQVAYEGWKKAELAKIVPTRHHHPSSGDGVPSGGVPPGSRWWGRPVMMVVWSVLIFVSLVSADVPALRGTIEVKATRWVIPVDEGTLTPVPVYLDDGATDHPRTLSPGTCQMVASAQPPRHVTVRAHNARMAVVQYHAPGFLDPQECEDEALVQLSCHQASA